MHDLYFSVSCTTRPPRAAETSGRDYIHLSEGEFQEKVRRGEFLEWARVHDHLYGTPKEPLFSRLGAGTDVLFDVDPQGAAALVAAYPGAVTVFVSPPDGRALAERLRRRGQDSEAVIEKRLANSRREMASLTQYQYLVINQDVRAALADIEAVVRAEHRRISRNAEEARRLLKEVNAT
jgi:guanylate kinase